MGTVVAKCQSWGIRLTMADKKSQKEMAGINTFHINPLSACKSNVSTSGWAENHTNGNLEIIHLIYSSATSFVFS